MPTFEEDVAGTGPMGDLVARRIAERKRLMARNIAQFQQSNMGAAPGSQLAMGPRAAAMLAQMNGPGRVVSGSALGQAAVAPETMPPSAPAIGRAGGVSELGAGTLDEGTRQRIQAAFAQRAARETEMGGNSQGNLARRRAQELALEKLTGTGPGRPTLESNNAKRFAKNMARAQAIQQFMLNPQLQLIAAQKGLDPMQQAHADLQKAQADYYRGMIGQQGGTSPAGQPAQPGEPPPGSALPGGGTQIAHGVRKRPMTWLERMYEGAVNRGSWSPYPTPAFGGGIQGAGF